MPNKSYYSAGVKGNGISLGLTDGNSNVGLGHNATTGSVGATTVLWDKTLPTTSTGIGNWSYNIQGLGITTDSSKSGIIVEPDTQLKLIIKY